MIEFDNDWCTANLEKGKTYKVEYTFVAGETSPRNMLPVSGSEITIDNISCIEIKKTAQEVEQEQYTKERRKESSYFENTGRYKKGTR